MVGREVGTSTRVLSYAAWELQRQMAPLMCLNRDEIVEALLLEPMDNEAGISLTPEEAAALLGRNWCCRRLKRLLCPPTNIWKLPSLRNQPSGLMLWVPVLLCPQLWLPMVTHPRKPRDPGKGLNPKAHQPPTQVAPTHGSWHTLRRMRRYQIGGKNSSSSATQVPRSSVNRRCRTW